MNQPVEPIPAGACEIETYPGEAAERRVAAGAFAPAGKRVRALNPRGTPPPVSLRPMAPRPASLEGRTIYLVDVRFMNGDVFLGEIRKLLAEKHPGVKLELRQKRGGYTETPAGGTIPRFAEAEKIAVLVVGGEKNAYWFATDFGYLKSESIDRWR